MTVFNPRAALYCLAFRRRKAGEVSVGALERFFCPEGWIYYVGRARRGWQTRLQRYVQPELNPHWHVDYLLTSEGTDLRGVCPVDWPAERECDLLDCVLDVPGSVPLTDGFGAGDCAAGCPSHAVYTVQPATRLFRQLAKTIHTLTGWIRMNSRRCQWTTFRKEGTGG